MEELSDSEEESKEMDSDISKIMTSVERVKEVGGFKA